MKIKAHLEGVDIDSISLPVNELSLKIRIYRTIKMFFLFILVAVLTILVPVFHFVLVPSFVIAAFVLSYLKFKEKNEVDISTMKCPNCQGSYKITQVAFHLDGSDIRIGCPQCQKKITLYCSEENQ